MSKDFSDIIYTGEPDFTAIDIVDLGEPDFTTLNVENAPEPDFTNLKLEEQVDVVMPEKPLTPAPVKKTTPKRVYYSGVGIPIGREGISSQQRKKTTDKLKAIGRIFINKFWGYIWGN